MATEKEQTLELKDFRGISRYLASPNTPPNKLYTIQNMYSPNRGELTYVGGVSGSSLSADGFTSIIGDFNFNGQRLLLNSAPAGTLPTPQAGNFTFAGSGGATTVFFRVTFSGLGYETDLSSSPVFTVANVAASGLGATVTLVNPSAIPNPVCAINFYISKTSGYNGVNLFWTHIGSFTRHNKAAFPVGTQTFQVGLPVYDVQNTALQVGINPYDPVSSVTFQGTTGGTLSSNQTYFFAFVPYVVGAGGAALADTQSATGAPIASMYIDPTSHLGGTFPLAYPASPLAYTLPDGATAIQVQITNTGKYDGVTAYTGIYVFMGTTPEDMLMVGITGSAFNGPCPFPRTTITSTSVTISQVPDSSNLGIAMLPYAQASTNTSAAIWTNQRIGFFWMGGPTYSSAAPLVSFTPTFVGGLLFPKNQLAYGSGANLVQVLPIRGASQTTGSAPGLSSQFKPTTAAPGQSTGQSLSLNGAFYYGILGGVAPNTPYISAGGAASAFFITNVDAEANVKTVHGAVLGSRMYFANGFQQPFYTNGYCFKPLMVDALSPYTPICANLIVFQNQLVMGSGPTNNYAVEGQIYWSAQNSDGTPNVFNWAQGGENWGSAQLSASILGNGPGKILGFGVFSYNQSVNALTSQLVIGLDSGLWMTPTLGQAAVAPQEVGKNLGFASPSCFVNTNVGAFYLGRDNLYQLNTYGYPVPKGSDVLQLLRAIPKSNTSFPPIVLFHEQQVKICYSSGGTVYDTELWCDVQLEPIEQSPGQSAPRYVWFGPHTINQALGYAVFPTGVYTDVDASKEDYRTAFGTSSALVLDYPGKTSNQGANAQRVLQFNDLYLSSDDFIKLFTRIYIGGLVNKITSIAVSFLMTDQDGAGEGSVGPPTPYTDTMVLDPASNASYKLFQKMFALRYRGRIVSQLNLTWSAGSSEEQIQFYEIGLLYKPTRRRLL